MVVRLGLYPVCYPVWTFKGGAKVGRKLRSPRLKGDNFLLALVEDGCSSGALSDSIPER